MNSFVYIILVLYKPQSILPIMRTMAGKMKEKLCKFNFTLNTYGVSHTILISTYNFSFQGKTKLSIVIRDALSL